MTYYRIEALDKESNETVGGYVSIAMAVAIKALGCSPLATEEELYEAFKHTINMNAKICYRLLATLTRIAQPEAYTKDRQGHCCLYTNHEYFYVMPALEELDEIIREETEDMYCLVYRVVEIPDEAVLYKDEHQVVVTWEDYEKYRAMDEWYEVAIWGLTDD